MSRRPHMQTRASSKPPASELVSAYATTAANDDDKSAQRQAQQKAHEASRYGRKQKRSPATPTTGRIFFSKNST